MKISRLLLACLAAAIVSSCATSKYIAPGTQTITGIAVLSPASVQGHINAAGQLEYSDSVSAVSAEILAKTLQAAVPGVTGHINADYQGAFEGLAGPIRSLAGLNAKSAPYANMPDQLDSLLRSGGYRYGLIAFSEGFTRDKSNWSKGIARGTAIAVLTTVLTLGMVSVYSFPLKFKSDIYVAIWDSETSQIVFYNKSLKEADPTNEKHVTKQIDKIMKAYRR